MTIQYPEEKTPVYPRFRGRHKLHRFEDNGLEKCVGCSLCAAACPADCIRVVAAENDPEHRVSAGERYAEVYEINLSRCIFCGYCEVACPFDAITMGHDYEMSDYNRSDLDLHQGDAARRTDRAHPAAEGGRVGDAPSRDAAFTVAPDNEQVVRDALEAWNAGDRERVLEWIGSRRRRSARFAPSWREGRTAATTGFGRRSPISTRTGTTCGSIWHQTRKQRPSSWSPLNVRSRGRTSGIELDVPLGWVWEFRDGRIVRIHSYSEPADAFRDAGIEP